MDLVVDGGHVVALWGEVYSSLNAKIRRAGSNRGPDPDGDGLANNADPDDDGDGTDDLSDAFPTDPLETTDTDSDGLGDNAETGTGSYVGPTDTGTESDNPDSDGDGVRLTGPTHFPLDCRGDGRH